MMDRYFIIKADDLKYIGFTSQWKNFLSICNDQNVSAALGLIGKSIDTPKQIDPEFLALIKPHEIFAHGYYHLWNEYTNEDLQYQITSIEKTITLVRQKLNMETVSFGAPHNKYNHITREALEHLRITNWLFGMDWNGNNLSTRNFEFEYSSQKPKFRNKYLVKLISYIRSAFSFPNLFSCRYEELVSRYNSVADQDLIVGQLHPKLWYKSDIKEFEKFLNYVKSKGTHKFITPCEYFNKIQASGTKKIAS